MGKKLALKKTGAYEVKPKPKGTTQTLVAAETKKGPSIFKPEDSQGGKVYSRASYKGMIPGENKAKESKRIAIQQEGMKTNALPKQAKMVGDKVAYDSGKSKGELAGSIRKLKVEKPAYTHTVKPLVKMGDVKKQDRPETDPKKPNPPPTIPVRQKGDVQRTKSNPAGTWINGGKPITVKRGHKKYKIKIK